MRRPLMIERHALGPRLHLFGRRVHEWHAGLALVMTCALAAIAGIDRGALLALVAAGLYLIAKDWRDLLPGTRDTGAWSVALHRPPRPLRTACRAGWMPALTGWLVAAVGLVNVASALTPSLPDRARLLTSVIPPEVLIGAHALSLSAGVSLLVASVFLRRRRQRAVQLALVLLVIIGILDLAKGLDVEEALMSWSLAAMLAWGRGAFMVRPDARPVRVARQIAVTAAGATVLALGAVMVATFRIPGLTPSLIVRETISLLMLTTGPLDLQGLSATIPYLVGAVAATTIARAIALTLRRPARDDSPCVRSGEAAELVRTHGPDTLSYFKLRGDLERHFSADGRAFVAFRVHHAVLLLAGDPVGPADAIAGLLRDICAYADEHGLKVGAVGASEAFSELARDAGLGRFYLGDEAIVDTNTFTLVGRPIRKVRQAVSRVTAAGYTTQLARLRDLDADTADALEAISERWRDGHPERGFSMAMDTLHNSALADTLAVIARDETGTPRGFLHFVPSGAGHGWSLSSMRRDRDTPNGLTDLLIVRAVELARESGVDELSLNFAAFARLMHAPAGPLDRVLGRLAGYANPYFQIESLYRHNAKFFPRWQPRYLLYDGVASLPRTALAALQAEGQLPSLPLPRLHAARGARPRPELPSRAVA